MKTGWTLWKIARLAAVALAAVALLKIIPAVVPVHAQGVPQFEKDPSWPKPLPNNWVIGGAASVAVDSHDHIWVITRPASVRPESLKEGQKPAPPVIEFDQEGNMVQAWGGPGPGYSWMETNKGYPAGGGAAEHGIFVDAKDNVWVNGNGHVALKFTRQGKFLMQIGELWKTGGSNDKAHLGSPTDIAVDPKTNDVFISDGYLNHRVIVFDEKGTYKRHWGAYGNMPNDDPPEPFKPDQAPPKQFLSVHCVKIANDGLVYVCDRQRNRVQVFRTDGTFVKEVIVAKETPANRGGLGDNGNGGVWRVAFSPDAQQKYLYVANSEISKIFILTRSDLQVVGSFDAKGVHHMGGADSKGNLYTSGSGKPDRYLFKGMGTAGAPSASR